MNLFRFTSLTLILVFLCFALCRAENEQKENIDSSILEESAKAFDPKEIAKKIGGIILDIQQCYSKELDKNKQLSQGEIKVRFKITAEGKTTDAAVRKSEVKNTLVENCIINLISPLTFPPSPEGEITVNYPFNFTNPNMKKGNNTK